ncbi:MAG: hypothetical protein OGM16_06265 [Lachnospiraceae bacterium]|nr:MAG: hypothetical protein OGM16_06265 [Lachnospiraceae bacterium]
MIGMVFGSVLSSARIALVAYSPSITGIITSIKITLKVPSGVFNRITDDI